MRNMSLRLVLLMVLSLSLIGCGGGGSGGGGSATISGYVNQFSGGYLEGVKVDVGGKGNAVTNSYGYFTTSSFPLGTYTISFTKEGYWTYSFPVTFDQTGSFQFNDTIYLCKTTSGTGLIENPSFIKDLNSDTHITIQAENQVKDLIAIAYNTYSWQSPSLSYVNITTDIGASLSSTIFQEKSLYRNLPNNKLEERLREFDNRVNQRLLSKGVKPGVSKGDFHAMSGEEQLTFYKYNFDQYDTLTTVTAKRKYEGTNCLIYLDTKQTIEQTYIDQLGQAFDTSYYDRMITYFGDLTIDVDTYPKVYILLSELPHNNDGMILGYFSSINEFSKAQEPYSNQKEMIYLTTYTFSSDPDSWLNLMKATSVHEFQHLINYSCRVGKGTTPIWINEGLSKLAEDIAVTGPGEHNPLLDDWVEIYLKYHQYDCLEDWQGDGLDYASAYMFMRYFADRCGENSIKNINTSNYSGKYALEDIADVSFTELFKDWLTAVILDAVGYTTGDPNLSKKYLYQTLNLSTFDLPLDSTGYINQAQGAGAFIYLPDIEAAKRIDVSVNGEYGSNYRLIMLPSSGASFSLFNTHGYTRLK